MPGRQNRFDFFYVANFMRLSDPVAAGLCLRSHAREKLFNSKLADSQGPALLAFNDPLFSDEDMDAVHIQSIYISTKRADTS